MNERPWETRDGRIWIGDRWASPKEVADHARDLTADRDKANAEAERLAEALLVARGEAQQLKAERDAARAALGATVAATLAPPAREGGAA